MKPILLFFAVLLAVPACTDVEAWGPVMMGGGVETEAGGSPLILDESFEATGYDDADWAETIAGSSVVNEDYSSSGLSMEGSYVLGISYNGGTAQTVNTLASSYDELWGKFMIRFIVSRPVGEVWILDASNNKIGGMSQWGTYLHGEGDNGTHECTGPEVSADTTYYIWWHWTRGTSNDTEYELFVSTDTTKPGSADCSVTNGNTAAQANKLQINGATGNTAYFGVDHVEVLTSGGSEWTTW